MPHRLDRGAIATPALILLFETLIGRLIDLIRGTGSASNGLAASES